MASLVRRLGFAIPCTVAITALFSACGIVTPPLPPKPAIPAEIRGSNDSPLIIDWPSATRGNLEIAMDRGVAVVAYTKDGIRLLDGCKLDGNYGMSRFRLKEETVAFESGDELRANLPLGGVGLAAKLEAEMQRGATLEVALVMVGKRAATWASARSEDVIGPEECKQATHFVRGAFVGAFAMQVGSKAHASTTAEIFTGKTGWTGNVSQSIRTTDGSLEECRAASSDPTAKANNCGALIHLELVKIDGAKVDPDIAGVGGASCPEGFVRVDGGRCKAKALAASHRCKADDPKDCEEQCAHKNAESCSTLAHILHYDTKGKRDYVKVADLYKQGCDGGSQAGCAGLGVLTMRGLGVKQDVVLAAQILDHACESGAPRACSVLGSIKQRGLGMTRDLEAGFKLFQRACDGGYAIGCNNVGACLDDGTGVARDPKKGSPYYKRACDGDEASGCRNLAMQFLGDEIGMKDPLRAEQLFMKACDLGQGYACRDLASEYASGKSLPKNLEKSEAFYKKAIDDFTLDCDGNEGDACSSLADAYAYGQGVPKDEAKAAALTEKSCAAGDYPEGCVDLGKMKRFGWYNTTKDRIRAKQLFTPACETGLGDACNQIAGMLEEDDDEEGENAKEVMAFLEKSCAASYGYGCWNLGRHHETARETPRDYAKAVTAYVRACDLRSGEGCAAVGVMLEYGRGSEKDPKKANEYYARSCNVKYAQGCRFLAMNLQDGLGTEADAPRAAKLFEQACDGGDDDSCDRLAKLYESGKDGLKENAAQALVLHRKGCDAGRASSCTRLASMYEDGRGTARDEMQAAVFYRKACEGKSAAGCKNLGDLYADGRGTGKDLAKAGDLYARSCLIAPGRACTLAGKMRLGDKLDKDALEATVAMLERGCDASDGEGCFLLGQLDESGKPPIVKRDVSAAYHRYGDACDYRSMDGCNRMAWMAASGFGVPRDDARAFNGYLRACIYGHAQACSTAGMYYMRGGGGIERNPDRAKMLFGRACDRGYKQACAMR